MHQPHHRRRHDKVSHGNVSLRINGALHDIGLGRHLHPITMRHPIVPAEGFEPSLKGS